MASLRLNSQTLMLPVHFACILEFHPWGFHEPSWNGEGNGNPLQYSWLENSRDRGADWAAVYGVTQSQTRLMRLSSSSMEWMGGEWFGIFKSTLTPLRWWRTLCSMPYIWYFLPAFCLWKILVKVVSLSENYKCHIAKENCQRTWNNNNVVIKHRQGPVVPPQGQ